MLKTEFESMRLANVTQIILQAPARLIGSVERSRTPSCEFSEVDCGEILITIHYILDANFVFPILIYVD